MCPSLSINWIKYICSTKRNRIDYERHPFLGLCLTRLTRTAWEWTKVLVLLSRKKTFYLSDRSDSTWLKNRCHLKNSLLDPLQRPFCVAAEGRLGERKIKRTGHAFSFFPPFPARFLFSIAAIFIGITSGSLCGGERLEKYKPCVDGGTYWFKNKFTSLKTS